MRGWLSGHGLSLLQAGRGSWMGRHPPLGSERAVRDPGPDTHSGPGGGCWAPAGVLGQVLPAKENSG